MINFIIAFFTITACFALGEIVNSIIFRSERPLIDFERTVFNIAAGIAAMSFIVFFLGIFGFVYAAVFWILLILLNGLSAYIMIKNQSFAIPKFSGFEKFAVLLILAAACAHVVL